jgi:hypothetical protein
MKLSDYLAECSKILGFSQLRSTIWDEIKTTWRDPVKQRASSENLVHWRSITRKIREEYPQFNWKAMIRTNTPSFTQMFPGIRTNKIAFMKLLDDLATTLPDLAPQSEETETGPVEYPGITGDWSSLRSVMSLKAQPAGTPTDESRLFKRQSIGTAIKDYPMITDELEHERYRYSQTLKMSQESLLLIDDLNSLYFRGLTPSIVKIPKYSQFAFPFNSKAPELRQAVINDWLRNGSTYMRMIDQGDLRSLAESGNIPVFEAGWRVQPEDTIIKEDGKAIGKKDRIAYDYRGQWVKQDRSLNLQMDYDELNHYEQELADRLASGRSRVINQAPPGMTMPMRMIAHAHHVSTVNDFPDALYFGGKDHLDKILKDTLWVMMWDVTNHDYAVPFEVMLKAREGYRSITSQAYGSLLKIIDGCPSLVPNDYLYEREILLRGDPFDIKNYAPDTEAHNKTGRPDTSKLAAYFNLVYITIAYYNLSFALAGMLGSRYQSLYGDLGLYSPDALPIEAVTSRRKELESFLRSEKALRISVTGDNALITASTTLAVFSLLHLRAANPYSSLGLTPTYNGLAPVKTSTGWIALRDLTTLAGRLLTHDRSIGDPRRGALSASLSDRESLFGQHPLFREVYDHIKNRIHVHLGFTLDQLAAADPQRVPPGLNLASQIDRDVYDDPSKAMWKYQTSQVSMELLRHYYLFIPLDQVRRLIGYVIGG